MGAKLSTTKTNNNFRNTLDTKNMNETGERISLDEVYESLEDYKEAIQNVYNLNDILDDYTDDFVEHFEKGDFNPINTVLLSTLHENYDKSAETNYCEVIELANNKSELNGCRMLFSCKLKIIIIVQN